MNSRSQRRSGTGWSVSITMLAIVLVANWLGAFDAPDGQIHDLFQRYIIANSEQDAVLLVESSPAILERDNPELRKLLESIANASPKVVGVVSERASLELGAIRDTLPCPLVEGRPANRISDKETVPTGFAELSFEAQPIFRFADQTASRQQRKIHSFERLLAAESGIHPPTAPIGIRYGTSIHAIPRISAAQILDDNFLPEMIRDRIVIVGESTPSSMGVYTPVSSRQLMPKLEVRAHTVLSLLRGNGYRKSGTLTSSLYLLAFWTAIYLLCRRLSTKSFVWALLGYTLAVIAVAFLSSYFAASYLPVSAALALTSLVPIWLWLRRFQGLSDSIASQNAQLNAQLATISQLNALDDPWQQIAPALKQFYPIKRLALLEIAPANQALTLVEGTGLVRESELLERRRDISRSPWKQSFELGKACQNDSFPVFKSAQRQIDQAENPAPFSGDVEFIVPLKFGSRIFGLMVLEVENEALQKWAEFERVASQFGQEFASQIAHQRATEKDSWTSLFSPPERSELAQIRRKQNILGESNHQLRQAFESDSCCRALFDATGQVLELNSRMLQRLGNENLSGNVKAVDMIARLSDLSPCDARRTFRESILRQRRHELKTNPESLPGTMVLSRVTWHSDASRDIFSQGLLVEIFDVRGIAESAADSMPEENVLRDAEDLVRASQAVTQVGSGKSLESTLQSAIFNAESWLQRKNQQIDQSFQCQTSFPAETCDAIGSAIEICLCVLSECAQDSETISIAMPATPQSKGVHEIQIYNGESKTTSPWPSPVILGRHSVEHLAAVDQKLQRIGGQVEFVDGFNGQVVISVCLPLAEQHSANGSTEYQKAASNSPTTQAVAAEGGDV